MGRLFAGTPFDRPPTCDRCGKLESECVCPPLIVERVWLDPETQMARLKVEKRPKGKVVTVVYGLDPEGNDLDELAARLKNQCGTGGTVKDGSIELQGDHRKAVEIVLKKMRYQVRLS